MFEWSAEQQSEWLHCFMTKMNSSSFLCGPARNWHALIQSRRQSNLVRDFCNRCLRWFLWGRTKVARVRRNKRSFSFPQEGSRRFDTARVDRQ